MAPFVKEHVLRRLLAVLDDDVRLTLITRWHPEEIAARVSDISCWELVKHRDQATFLLCPTLHAKYYRVDEEVLLGSANLTGRALGWTLPANLELLVAAGRDSKFEAEAEGGSYLCTDAIAGAMQEAASALQVVMPPGDTAAYEVPASALESWVPATRNPEDLYEFYRGNLEDLTSQVRDNAQGDLAQLRVPPTLSLIGFRAVVRASLLVNPLVRELDDFLTIPRRFGEVTDWLDQRLDEEDSDRAWQSLMRWMLHFAPDRYLRSRPRHSEIFQRVDLTDSSRLTRKE